MKTPENKQALLEAATEKVTFIQKKHWLGFLTQDEPDSENDEVINEESQLSMEEKIEQMENEATAWINYFLDNYNYSIINTFSLQPIYRIKGVMTGVLLTLTVIEPNRC